MKSCEYCGKQYADDVAVCPVDGQLVINQVEKQRKIAAQPEATGTAFNVKLVSPISSAGKYRVFVERSDLLFIQVEGCLLYTSDAADEEDSVDFGGRRIIK